MKNHKLIKLGILTSSALVLGLGQPVLQTVLPGFDGGVVKAEEDDSRRPLKVFAYGYEGDKRVELIPESVEYVTPNSPYTVAHPKVDGWKPTVTVLGTFDGTISRVESGSKLTYDDLYYEGGAGGGGINYVYERVSESEGETSSKPEETSKVAEDKQEERSIAIQYVEINSDGSTHSIAPEGNFPIDAFLSPSDSYTVSHPTIDGYTPSGAALFTNGVETTLEDGKELNYNDIGEQRAMYNGVLTYKYTAVSNTAPKTPVQPADSGQPNPEENRHPIKFRLHYWDDSFGANGLPTFTDIQDSKEIYLQPGQSVTEVAPDIPGYTLATNISSSSITLEYDKVSESPSTAGAGFDGDSTPRIGFHYTKIEAEKPNEIQPEKTAENTARHLYISYIKSGGLERPDGLTSATGIIHSTVLLKPGESYIFPDVTAPGYQLLGVYEGDKELAVGGSISYEDITYNKDSDFYASDIYYIYGRTPNAVSKEIPAGAVKYRILNYDDTMDGTIPTYTEVAPAKEGYVLPGETLVIKPSDIPGYTFTKRLPWGAEQADLITITTKSLGGSVSGIIQDSFFYTKNPEATPTPTTPVKPPKQVEKPVENEQPFKYRIYYIDADTGKELLLAKEKFLAPGQSVVELPEKIAGYYDATYGKKVELTKDLLSGKELSVYISEDKDGVPMLGFAYRKEETPDPTKESIKYRVHYRLAGLNALNKDLIPPKEAVLKHAESIIEQPVAIPGYKIADGTFPQIDLNYYMLAGKQYVQYIGMDPDGVQIITFVYQVDPDFKPTSKPEEKPVAPVQPPKLDDKPSEQPITPVKPVETPSEPKTPVVPLQPTTPVTPTNPTNSQNSRVLSNLDGSVRVHGSEITLKDVSYIKVEEVVANPLSSKDYKAFDIHLYDASGKAIQPKGMVVVSVQADKPVEKVYYVAPDGDLQELDFTQEGNKVSFKTNHFSIYALAFRKLEAYRNGENGGVMIRQEQLPVSNESIKADKNEETKVTLSADKQSDARSLPDTGETQSSLSLFGYILALFGLAGWLYQGRHDRKR